MSRDSIDTALLAHTLKSGHSLSLDGHFANTPHRVHPRSALMGKMKSIPKLPVDNSYEAVQEAINRSVLHRVVYEKNPHVFRRGGESDNNFSRFNTCKHDVRNLLPDMHPVSDKNDICPPKFGYNFSRIERREPELRSSVEDFLQPKDQTHQRKTGYSKGHIRSILELDTFGPAHSEKVNNERKSGKLPMSPNLDRNFSPDSSKRDDASSGFWSGDDDSNGSFGSKSFKSSPKNKALFGGTWDPDMLNATLRDKTQPLVRPSTSGYRQDARGTNWDYFKERTAMLKAQEVEKQRQATLLLDRKRQKREAEEYQRFINDFEAHLKSIQY